MGRGPWVLAGAVVLAAGFATLWALFRGSWTEGSSPVPENRHDVRPTALPGEQPAGRLPEPGRVSTAEPTREGKDAPPVPRSLTTREVGLLLPMLEELEVHAEARRYQRLEAYGEASVDHIGARWDHLKMTLLLRGVKAGRGRRAATPEDIWQATHRPPAGKACIAAHLRGMDLLVDLEGEDARAWNRASQEVEAAMRRIAPPPMTPRLPPGGQLPTPSGTSR